MATDIRDGRGHRAYRRKRAALRRRVAASQGTSSEIVCAWCGEPFDLTLPDTSRMGFTADHPQALKNGGHLVNQDLAPLHNLCNTLKSDTEKVEIWSAS